MESRKLVCLGTTRVWDISREVTEAGWLPYPVRTFGEAAALFDEARPLIGVMLLDGKCPSRNKELEELLVRTAGQMEWVGLVPAEFLEQPSIRELLAKYLYDYHTLPVDTAHLLATLGHAYGMAALRASANQARGVCVMGHGRMIGESAAMQRIFRQINRVATVDSSVMVLGESGTGKELAARLIHQRSPRHSNPFVAVNCGAIPANLIQSELFGHEKGAFTGACRRQIGHIEAANGGTLFLDEIGDLPLELQVNLLRFLQERVISRIGATDPIQVDVRIITATHRDLQEEVKQGRFREDLFYRLSVLDLTLPPLRERREDIEPLAYHYLQRYGPTINPLVRGFSNKAVESMRAHDWPGNVRELRNKVERALVMCEKRVIGVTDLELDGQPSPQEDAFCTLAQARAEAEQQAMQAALYLSGNNIQQAARRLGVSRVTLYRMLDKYKLAVN